MSLNDEDLVEFINSTLPDNLSIDYNSNTKLPEEKAEEVLRYLKPISEFPRRLNQNCIIGTSDYYYQSLILFPCCGYNHGACETSLKDYLTNVGVTCPMCRQNMIENIPVLQPQQRLNLDFGLSTNENCDALQSKKHVEIGHYIGHKILIEKNNVSVSFRKSTFCLKVLIPKKNKNVGFQNRNEWVFYNNMNLKTQKKLMRFVIWYEEQYTNNKFYSENVLWNLICQITEKFKNVSRLFKKEFQNTNYIKLYNNFINSLYNLSNKYLKTNYHTNYNTNNIDNIECIINKERASYINMSVFRNNNYKNDVEFINQNSLLFYNTSINNIKNQFEKYVCKLNYVIQHKNLTSEKKVFEFISNICNSMANIHQFIINYLNYSDLNNSSVDINHLEDQKLGYLSEIYQLLFINLNLQNESYIINRNINYSNYDINYQMSQITQKINNNYNYLLFDNNNIRKITFPIVKNSYGFIESTLNRLNLIDNCIMTFQNWLLQKLINTNETINNTVWECITLELYYFNNSQKYFHVLSYRTISDIIKSNLQKLKQKVESLIDKSIIHLNNLQINNSNNNILNNNSINNISNNNKNKIHLSYFD